MLIYKYNCYIVFKYIYGIHQQFVSVAKCVPEGAKIISIVSRMLELCETRIEIRD
jgi:hypothetical protein